MRPWQVCGNLVGVKGRKLDTIRARLGSAGFHLRVNHQMVDADEVSNIALVHTPFAAAGVR